MRYQHDCDTCKPLGEYGDADLYFCDKEATGMTVIARYGDEGSNYSSGLNLTGHIPDLAEAKKRAIKVGFLTDTLAPDHAAQHSQR